MEVLCSIDERRLHCSHPVAVHVNGHVVPATFGGVAYFQVLRVPATSMSFEAFCRDHMCMEGNGLCTDLEDLPRAVKDAYARFAVMTTADEGPSSWVDLFSWLGVQLNANLLHIGFSDLERLGGYTAPETEAGLATWLGSVPIDKCHDWKWWHGAGGADDEVVVACQTPSLYLGFNAAGARGQDTTSGWLDWNGYP